MVMTIEYPDSEPTREAVAALKGLMVIEFGTPWCGHCRAAQPLLAKVFADYPHIPHMKIEDGPGQPLGRSFKVRLWPTFIFLCDGQEVTRLVRPVDTMPIRQAFEQMAEMCAPLTLQSR
jgi:thioredoxin 1